MTGSSSVAVSTAVTITVSGLTMGAVTAGATGVSIITSNDASSSPTQINSGHVRLPPPSPFPPLPMRVHLVPRLFLFLYFCT
jgi:hypothetical protein